MRRSEPSRFDVLGVGVSAVDLLAAADVLEGWIGRCERRYVCVTNVHAVMESQDDAAFRALQNAAGMAVPDGMPLVWLARRAGYRNVGRVAGTELMVEMLTRGGRHYLFGGAPGVAEDLARIARERFPRSEVCGTDCPPFRDTSPEEGDAAIARINASSADVVWVGLGCPKQERWMAANRYRLEPPVLVGVGAAFDFLSGRKRRAPVWMQHAGLEWLHRLGQEPRRLLGRYVVHNARFLWRIVRGAAPRHGAASGGVA